MSDEPIDPLADTTNRDKGNQGEVTEGDDEEVGAMDAEVAHSEE